MPTDKDRITVNVSEPLRLLVEARAKAERRSVSNYIAGLIENDLGQVREVQAAFGPRATPADGADDVPTALERAEREKRAARGARDKGRGPARGGAAKGRGIV